MGRPLTTAGGRPHVVATRLSKAEKAYLDSVRGSLLPAEYLRLLLTRDRKAREGAPKA